MVYKSYHRYALSANGIVVIRLMSIIYWLLYYLIDIIIIISSTTQLPFYLKKHQQNTINGTQNY